MLNQNIINAYSNVHTTIEYTNDDQISFEGSQKQVEFFTAWNNIEKFYAGKDIKELTFLEIGAWKGLWGIAFAEFCKLNNIKGKYVTVTLIDQDPNNQGLFNSSEYIKSLGLESVIINENTLSESVLDSILNHEPNFNIVFIDADHSYEAVMNDINKFATLATDMLLFHDIRPKEVHASCGVYQAIVDSNITLDEEIISHEQIMGIGIKYIK
jgi:hypothetical protein